MSGEGALSVFARAKELEPQGPLHHPSRVRRARTSIPANRSSNRPPKPRGRQRPLLRRGRGSGVARRNLPLISHALATSKSSPDNIVIAPGCKIALFLAMMALLEPGDEVLYPDPGFPGYESITRGLGAVAVPFTLSAQNQFQPDPSELAAKITPRTRMLITNSPGNPTGTVYLDAVQLQLAELAVQHDLVGALRRNLRPHYL